MTMESQISLVTSGKIHVTMEYSPLADSRLFGARPPLGPKQKFNRWKKMADLSGGWRSK